MAARRRFDSSHTPPLRPPVARRSSSPIARTLPAVLVRRSYAASRRAPVSQLSSSHHQPHDSATRKFQPHFFPLMISHHFSQAFCFSHDINLHSCILLSSTVRCPRAVSICVGEWTDFLFVSVAPVASQFLMFLSPSCIAMPPTASNLSCSTAQGPDRCRGRAGISKSRVSSPKSRRKGCQSRDSCLPRNTTRHSPSFDSSAV